MTKRVLIIAFAFMTCLALGASQSYSQSICDYKEFRLEEIKGRVISDGPKGYEPIPRAKVELWRVGGADEDDVLVASTLSGDNGYFEINSIKRGKYRLEISKWESGFIMNFVGLKVVKRAKDSERGKGLVFRLGVDALKPCGGGSVVLQ